MTRHCATERLQESLELGNETTGMTDSKRLDMKNPKTPNSTLLAYSPGNVRECLEMAKHQRGCKRLLGRSITFKKINQANQSNSIDSEAEVIMTVKNDDRKGFIAVYETDMMAPPATDSSCRSGHSSTVPQPWHLVHIIKPLWMYKGSGELILGPLSGLVISIPRSQVAKMGDVWVPSPEDPAGGSDPEPPSLRASLLYTRSKDGVPSFEWSEKKRGLPWLGSDEFLTLGMFFEYLDYNPNDGSWSNVGERYKEECLKWKEVQDAMAESACIVEIESEPGEGWEDIPPLDESTRERGHDKFPLKYGA